ncbi:MAG: AgmX/PglI C-terminal domain-containing protein [Myxococcota bacterium]
MTCVEESVHFRHVHAEITFAEDGVKIVDLGSTNGFTVNGKKSKQANLTTGDRVMIADFEITVRILMTLDDGWDTASEGGWVDHPANEREDTRIHASTPLPDEKVAGRMGSSPSATAEDEEQSEDDERPDLPKLITCLHGEAAGLLAGAGEWGVEVIETLGDDIHGAWLLKPGVSYWWGGDPGIAMLWKRPTKKCFPLVTHFADGTYCVQMPEDTRWKLFHRGGGQFVLHRNGILLKAQAQPREQLEVAFGPFSYFIRSVRLMSPKRTGFSWRHIRPQRRSAFVLLGSLCLHLLVAGIPLPKTPALRMNVARAADFVEVSIAQEVAEVTPEPIKEADPEELAETPAPAETAQSVKKRKPPKRVRRRVATRRSLPEPIAEVPDDLFEDDKAPVQPARAAVSVNEFKVFGTIAHLPAATLDEPSDEFDGGADSTTEGAIARRGAVDKSGNAAMITPKGKMSRAALARVINSNAKDIRRCYAEARKTNPTAQGRIDLQWVVDASRFAQRVRVVSDDVGSAKLIRCLQTVVKRWRFPEPKGGAALVSYPFTFRR